MYYHALTGILSVILVTPQGGTFQISCPYPYSCETTAACGKTHKRDSLNNQVLFQCGPGYLCCPPVQNGSSTERNRLNTRETSRQTTSEEYGAIQQRTTKNFVTIESTVESFTPSTLRKTTPPPISPKRPYGFSMPLKHRNLALLPENCGVTLVPTRIVEGDDATVGEFPWMALIGFTGFNGVEGFVCGGTLISDRYILTAAHCLHKDGAKLTHVRLGEFDLSEHKDCNGEDCYKPAVDLAVEKIIAHNNWNEKTYRNDIGLIRLNTSALSLGLSTVAPICLPVNSSALNITANRKYETAGWGLTGWRELSLSKKLQKTNLNGISDNACNTAICPDRREVPYCPILPRQICVQGNHKRDVCKGDSGGPLMTYKEMRTVQIGITSFKATEICGEDNIPSIFTRTDKYLEWILDNMEP